MDENCIWGCTVLRNQKQNLLISSSQFNKNIFSESMAIILPLSQFKRFNFVTIFRLQPCVNFISCISVSNFLKRLGYLTARTHLSFTVWIQIYVEDHLVGLFFVELQLSIGKYFQLLKSWNHYRRYAWPFSYSNSALVSIYLKYLHVLNDTNPFI